MDQLEISATLSIPLRDIQFNAVRAGGPGGQHVNKVATGIELRFDIPASSLPDPIKQRLLRTAGQRISRDGVLIIRATQARSQERNRAQALATLQNLLQRSLAVKKRRKATRPSRSSVERRLQGKKLRGRIKQNRARVRE